MLSPKDFFQMVRIWSTPLNVFAVAMGSLAAWPSFDAAAFAVAAIGVTMINLASNVANDIYDFKNGADRPEDRELAERGYLLVSKKATAAQEWRVFFALIAIAIMCGIYLSIRYTPIVIPLGIAGIMITLLYSAPKKSAKAIGAGEFLVFLTYGILVVEGAYLLQTGSFSYRPVIFAMPISILIVLVLLANNIRDIKKDSAAGMRTLASRLGPARSKLLFSSMLGLIYLFLIAMPFIGMLPLFSIPIMLATIPLAIKLNRKIVRRTPRDAAAQVSNFSFWIGGLMVLSLLL